MADAIMSRQKWAEQGTELCQMGRYPYWSTALRQHRHCSQTNRHRLSALRLGPQMVTEAALKQWIVFPPPVYFFDYVQAFNFTSTLSGETDEIRKGLLKRNSSTGIP